LLLDRRRDRGGEIADALDGLADRLDGTGRLFGRLDLLRHHGKTAAVLLASGLIGTTPGRV
jgi:hypothetical protein